MRVQGTVRRGGVAAALAVLGLLGLLGCDTEPVTRPLMPAPEALFWDLTLSHRAINLSTAAPYDTIRVTATPWNGAGAPMAGAGEVTWTTSDSTAVRVIGDGLLQARRAARNIRVVAQLTVDGPRGPVTHRDTALVHVTALANPPVLTTFSIDPAPPDSVYWTMLGVNGSDNTTLAGWAGYPTFFANFIQPLAIGQANDTIRLLAVEFHSLDSTVAELSWQLGFGFVTARHRVGPVGVVARTTAYGVTMTDTAWYVVAPPVYQSVDIQLAAGGSPTFSPREITIRPGGLAFWNNRTDQPVDITFDDPANVAEDPGLCARHASLCGAGNVPAFSVADTAVVRPATGTGSVTARGIRARKFPVAGVYPYRDTISGATGRIVVRTGAAGS